MFYGLFLLLQMHEDDEEDDEEDEEDDEEDDEDEDEEDEECLGTSLINLILQVSIHVFLYVLNEFIKYSLLK